MPKRRRLRSAGVRTKRWPRSSFDRREQLLHKLLPEEKGILGPYVKDGVTSYMFDMGNGIVGGLVDGDILFRSSNVGEVYSFPYNLRPWAREYLEANPHLLVGAKVPPRRRVI